MSELHPIDEQRLRRALRLDADERPARLDARLLAAAAGERRSPAAAYAVAAIAFAVLSVSTFGAAVRIAGDLVSLLLLGDAAVVAANVLELLARPLIAALTQPAIPIAVLVSIIVAALYERRVVEVTHA